MSRPTPAGVQGDSVWPGVGARLRTGTLITIVCRSNVRLGRQGAVAVLGVALLLHPDGGGQGRGHAGAETAVRGAEPLRGEAVGPGRVRAAAVDGVHRRSERERLRRRAVARAVAGQPVAAGHEVHRRFGHAVQHELVGGHPSHAHEHNQCQTLWRTETKPEKKKNCKNTAFSLAGRTSLIRAGR